MFNTTEEIEKYAKNKNIVLPSEDVIDYIQRRIKLFRLNKILEVDSSLAYTIIKYASCDENIKIDDYELTRDNFIDNVKIIKDFNLSNNVDVFFSDLNSIIFNNKYNLIVIDLINKSHLKLFEKEKELLEANGFFIINNINYYKKMNKLKKESNSKDLDEYINNIENIMNYFDTTEDFLVEYIEVGEGLIVAQKVIK